MCGIAGILWDRPEEADASHARRVLARLAHRGPDDEGSTTPVPGATLLHRRLSILDLTDAAHQPMATPDGRYHLVFNGEIYNYVELRQELARLGVSFSSSGDTEVLLAGFARWGVGVLPRLVGMFAFAVLDAVERRLLLARDFAGIKPLYHARWDGGLAFASELKALRLLPGVGTRLDAQRAYDYLHLGLTDHGDATLYAGIGQVPAGTYCWVDLDRPAVGAPQRFWTPPATRRDRLSFDGAVEELRALFLESVRLHMRSDVPVGAALSGGIDSSAIVAAMRAAHPTAELHAFSYIAEDPQLSEEQWVDLAATHAGAMVHKVRPGAADLAADLDALIRVQDEPFGSTSIYAQYRVFGLAKEAGIKVMLDGQGADELFGGYKLHVAARLASLVRRGRWAAALAYLTRLRHVPAAGAWTEQAAYAVAMLAPQALQAPFMQLMGRDAFPDWLDRDWFDARGVRRRAHLWGATQPDVLREMLRRSFGETILPMLLRYEDRNSMAHSIESRVPFLTPAMADYAFSLPEAHTIAKDGTTKAVFRAALRGLVPDAILDRRDKVGFVTPEKQWLAELKPWVDGVLDSETARQIPFLRHDAVQAEWEAVLAGRRRFDFRVWRWINFIRWAEFSALSFD